MDKTLSTGRESRSKEPDRSCTRSRTQPNFTAGAMKWLSHAKGRVSFKCLPPPRSAELQCGARERAGSLNWLKWERVRRSCLQYRYHTIECIALGRECKRHGWPHFQWPVPSKHVSTEVPDLSAFPQLRLPPRHLHHNRRRVASTLIISHEFANKSLYTCCAVYRFSFPEYDRKHCER